MAFSGIPSGAVDRGTFARFAQSIDPSWIEEALAATGTTTLRKRRLPAEQVVWLVLGMALFRNLSIEEVVRQLDVALPSASGKEVVPSAISQARARLGPAPLRRSRSSSIWRSRRPTSTTATRAANNSSSPSARETHRRSARTTASCSSRR
jgi:hypothetical protein